MFDLSEKLKQTGFKQTPLVEQIAHILTDSIVEGDLEGGEQLIEAKLQEQFGISKSPIREAFRVLEKNGFVEIIPRRGTFVRKISKKDVKENFPIRAYLESLAAGSATPRLSSRDIGEMTKVLASMEKARRKKDSRKYLEQHMAFHDIFIAACGNDSLIDILKRLRRQAFWFRCSYHHFQTAVETTIKVHREILKHFIAKDARRAEDLVKQHILDALDEFIISLGAE